MLPRSTRPTAYATDATLPPSVGSGTGSVQQRAVIADPCLDQANVVRILRPAPHGAPETVAKVDRCPPRPTNQVACADDARCVCPLSGHITDTERAVLNDVCDQAARLATALRWIIALVALAVLVVLLR